MTSSQAPPDPDEFAEQFFDKSVAVIEQVEASGKFAPIRALADEWHQATRQQPPQTHFGGLVALAMDLTLRIDDGDDWPLLDLIIGAWLAMIEDPEFKRSTPHSRAVTWNNLGQGLLRRFEARGNAADLDQAVAAQQEAVRATNPETPNRGDYYAGLSFLMLRRGNFRNDDGDRAASVEATRAWVNEQRPGSDAHLVAIHMMADAVKSWSGEAEAASLVDEIRRALPCFRDRSSSLQLTAQLATALRILAQKRPGTVRTAAAEIQAMLGDASLPEDVSEYLEDELARLGAVGATARPDH